MRGDHFRYTRYFDGGEELYDHRVDPNEWNNLAGKTELLSDKQRLASNLPSEEAPLVRQGVGLWNVIDADRPERLEAFKTKDWPMWLEKMRPRLD